MPESLRLFFALWPDLAVRAALARAMPLPGPGGRSVPKENLHVTLAFLGNTAPQRVRDLVALADDLRGAAFELTFVRYEVWDRALVTLVPQDVPAALERLARDLTVKLAASEFPTDLRPYRAHVTLVRERRRGGGRRDGLLAPVAAPVGFEPIVWPVTHFALVRSQPGQGGSRYEVMQRWALGEEGTE